MHIKAKPISIKILKFQDQDCVFQGLKKRHARSDELINQEIIDSCYYYTIYLIQSGIQIGVPCGLEWSSWLGMEHRLSYETLSSCHLVFAIQLTWSMMKHVGHTKSYVKCTSCQNYNITNLDCSLQYLI